MLFALEDQALADISDPRVRGSAAPLSRQEAKLVTLFCELVASSLAARLERLGEFLAKRDLGNKSGLMTCGFEDQLRDFHWMGDQGEVASLHFDSFGRHPFGHEALEVRIDCAVFR